MASAADVGLNSNTLQPTTENEHADAVLRRRPWSTTCVTAEATQPHHDRFLSSSLPLLTPNTTTDKNGRDQRRTLCTASTKQCSVAELPKIENVIHLILHGPASRPARFGGLRPVYDPSVSPLRGSLHTPTSHTPPFKPSACASAKLNAGKYARDVLRGCANERVFRSLVHKQTKEKLVRHQRERDPALSGTKDEGEPHTTDKKRRSMVVFIDSHRDFPSLKDFCH